MIPHQKTTRILAALLVLGGVVGVALTLFMGVQLLSEAGPLSALIVVLALPFGWALAIGIELWRGTSYGRKWAPVIFATQIPIVLLPSFHYEWFTGFVFGLVLLVGPGDTTLHFAANLGANIQILIGSESSVTGVGFNLVALIAVLLLVRSNRAQTDGSVQTEFSEN